MWASTGNPVLKEKMSALVSGLATCQDKMGTGYLSAFPSEEFDRFEAVQPVWAPYYTIHKVKFPMDLDTKCPKKLPHHLILSIVTDIGRIVGSIYFCW